MQAQNKKRVHKARITADFLRKLPEGISYHEQDSSGDDEPKQVSDLGGVTADDEIDYKEGDIVRVGKFRINLEKVTKAQLISMRKLLPPAQYRLIKNRKTARLCRRKRKEERGDMQRILEELRKENMYYRLKVEDLERKLIESERARSLEKELNQAESLANMSNLLAQSQGIVDTPANQVENVNVNELIRSALRRGSVTSNFNNQPQQPAGNNSLETHNRIQKTIRALSLSDIYKPQQHVNNNSMKDSNSVLGMHPPMTIPAIGNGSGRAASGRSDFIRATSDTVQGAIEKTAKNFANLGVPDTPSQPGIDGSSNALEGPSNATHQYNSLHQQSENAELEAASNADLSISRMFHRPNLRSFSLASVSDLAKV